ncbi:hypothetical protein A5722_14075 [Mycobacterium vulneris]|uniref:Uncharacterized protein n=2 Tax=Mycolicibacterium porcinum TaxID=39693 RepID=A0AAP7SJ77_9MYCO|nr:hypothetical protein [Mycolicibacterium porcinum]OCB50120.1 hypothetical protein A5721_31125 [Mycolicibacterium vulneris]OCB15349.1 hypothetical protein A5717_07600 [Mycolicibacterium porcinum]OCB56546.1 hypothetical protein A5722_14075 [Mycolicibacterium vulneris]OCB67493.1 hypothetical protein A5729_01265 [Mycolicibacterium vulneris]
MGHRHAMATAKVMRTAAFTGCDSPHGDVSVRTRPRPAASARQSDHGLFEQPRRRRYIGQLKTSTSTVAGRSPWMNDRVTVLRRYLADLHGLHLPPELARVQVAGHIELLVSVLRLNRQTARQFVTDDVLREMAVDIATAVASE